MLAGCRRGLRTGGSAAALGGTKEQRPNPECRQHDEHGAQVQEQSGEGRQGDGGLGRAAHVLRSEVERHLENDPDHQRFEPEEERADPGDLAQGEVGGGEGHHQDERGQHEAQRRGQRPGHSAQPIADVGGQVDHHWPGVELDEHDPLVQLGLGEPAARSDQPAQLLEDGESESGRAHPKVRQEQVAERHSRPRRHL